MNSQEFLKLAPRLKLKDAIWECIIRHMDEYGIPGEEEWFEEIISGLEQVLLLVRWGDKPKPKVPEKYLDYLEVMAYLTKQVLLWQKEISQESVEALRKEYPNVDWQEIYQTSIGAYRCAREIRDEIKSMVKE